MESKNVTESSWVIEMGVQRSLIVAIIVISVIVIILLSCSTKTAALP